MSFIHPTPVKDVLETVYLRVIQLTQQFEKALQSKRTPTCLTLQYEAHSAEKITACLMAIDQNLLPVIKTLMAQINQQANSPLNPYVKLFV